MSTETPVRPSGVPEAAKPKTIKPLAWEGPRVGERMVWVNETTRSADHQRTFDVYDADGTLLGGVEGHVTSITSKIAGTRLVRRGRQRLLWFPAGESWNDHESMAAVIRRLLEEHDRKQRRAKS